MEAHNRQHIANAVLLHTSNLSEAKEEIAAKGGRVTQILSPSILLATFPEDFDKGKLNLSTHDIPDGIDGKSRLAVQAWRSRVNRVPSDKEKETDGLPWDTEGFEAPMKLTSDENFEDADAALAATIKANNDMLIGNVAVALVLVDSTGWVHFNDDEVEDLIGQGADGAQFLAGCEPAADITFTWEQYHVTIPGDEKIPDTTLKTGLSAVVYNKKLYAFHQDSSNTSRIWYNTHNGAKWEGNSGVPNTATGGTISAVVYNGKLYCFHKGSGDDKEKVKYNVWDGKTWAGDKVVPSSTTTSGIATVVYDSKLYVFHQGSGNASSRIYYNVLDGSEWLGNKEVPSTPADEGMTAVVCEKNIFLIHQGSGKEKSTIRFNSFNGSKWNGDQKIADSDTGSGLSAIVQNDRIFCFHRGSGGSTNLKLHIYRSKSWIGEYKVADVGMSGNPSVASFNNHIYCLHPSSGSNSDQLWYRVFDGIEFGNSYDALESIWRNPALKKLGYQQGWRGLAQFTTDLCTKHKTSRGYLVFITKFSQAWSGYERGNGVFIQYYNDGWGHKNIYKTFAHETSHVFGAGDEYGHANCDKRGKYKVTNGNGRKCTSHQVDCVMNANSLVMCDYTKGQLGWLPRSGVFIFYQSGPDDGELWYEVYDGKAWWTARQVPKTTTTWSPSAIEYNKNVYCFHHGSKNNGQLWYNVFDGSNWAGDQQVPKTGISKAPSTVIYNNKIYCFYQGVNDNGQLRYNVFDGHSWAGDSQVPNTKMTASPSPVVYKNKLYCFHRGADKGELRYNVFDGSKWGGDTKISSDGISDGPSAVTYKDSIFCFYQGKDNNGKLLYTTYNGSKWSTDIQVPNTALSGAPSTMTFEDDVYCFHLSSGGDGQLRYNTYDGSKWTGDSALAKKGILAGPMATMATFPG